MPRTSDIVDPIPVYFKLQKDVQKKIENGHWVPGDSIPTERVLAETHSVSIGTVKKALLNLVQERYLYRIQGKGTFVAGTTLRRESLRYYRLRRDFKDDEAALKIKFLEIKKLTGRLPHNQYLKIKLDEDLFELKRLFIREKEPIIYNISYLPCRMFKNLNQLSDSRFEKITLYEALEKEYGVPTIYNQELFGTTTADAETARLLGIRKNTALLMIEMLSFTYKDKPYEYRVSHCLTDQRKIVREI